MYGYLITDIAKGQHIASQVLEPCLGLRGSTHEGKNDFAATLSGLLFGLTLHASSAIVATGAHSQRVVNRNYEAVEQRLTAEFGGLHWHASDDRTQNDAVIRQFRSSDATLSFFQHSIFPFLCMVSMKPCGARRIDSSGSEGGAVDESVGLAFAERICKSFCASHGVEYLSLAFGVVRNFRKTFRNAFDSCYSTTVRELAQNVATEFAQRSNNRCGRKGADRKCATAWQWIVATYSPEASKLARNRPYCDSVGQQGEEARCMSELLLAAWRLSTSVVCSSLPHYDYKQQEAIYSDTEDTKEAKTSEGSSTCEEELGLESLRVIVASCRSLRVAFATDTVWLSALTKKSTPNVFASPCSDVVAFLTGDCFISVGLTGSEGGLACPGVQGPNMPCVECLAGLLRTAYERGIAVAPFTSEKETTKR